MKRIFVLLGLIAILLCGCRQPAEPADIAATTLPVYEFTTFLCRDTGLTVTRLVTENVSCLHDYSLNVGQVRAAEGAQLIVLSGAGLEEFMEDVLDHKKILDASRDIPLLENCHDHDHDHGDQHLHEFDPHIWLSPNNARLMAINIWIGLTEEYPEHRITFAQNLQELLAQIDALQAYGETQLVGLSAKELVTFHDGFGYLAEAYGLTIVKAIEEESGAEASAAELKQIIGIVREHDMTAIFTETNGSCSAAQIIAAETGTAIYTLDMAMSGDSWFTAMYHNIDTLKEALK